MTDKLQEQDLGLARHAAAQDMEHYEYRMYIY